MPVFSLPENLITRRRFLAASAAGAGALVANACIIQPNRLWVSEHVLGDGPTDRQPLRLAQLSDLHLRRVGRTEEQIAEAVHRLAPEVVLLTGDVIDRADQLHTLRSFLVLLPGSSTTYAVLGNWEHWARVDVRELRRIYDAHGVRLLVNQSVQWEHRGIPVLLTGVDDATAGTPDLSRALAGVEPSANHLILAHSPIFRDRMGPASLPQPVHGRDGEPVREERNAPPYMLSGHTHGGQINVLGMAPFRPPGSGRYVRGWYRDRHPHMYVSQGLGTSVIPARLGSVPEIASFTWRLHG